MVTASGEEGIRAGSDPSVPLLWSLTTASHDSEHSELPFRATPVVRASDFSRDTGTLALAPRILTRRPYGTSRIYSPHFTTRPFPVLFPSLATHKANMLRKFYVVLSPRRRALSPWRLVFGPIFNHLHFMDTITIYYNS